MDFLKKLELLCLTKLYFNVLSDLCVVFSAYPLILSISELLLKLLQCCQQPVNIRQLHLTPAYHTCPSSS